MAKIKNMLAVIMSLIILLCSAVFSVNSASDTYKDKFIDKLINNQDYWNYENGTDKNFYFCDIDFDGNLELFCERDVDLYDNKMIEVIGYSDGELFKYYLGRDIPENTETNIQENLSLYYDPDTKEYKWFSFGAVGCICCNATEKHTCYSNYEVQIYKKRMFKDYFTAYCSKNGYYELYRKGDPQTGYEAGSYGYNISGPTDSTMLFDRINSERIQGLEKKNFSIKSVSFNNSKSMNNNNLKKALEESYSGFKYGDFNQTSKADNQIDYSIYNCTDFLGKSLDEITEVFGDDYTKVEEREAGATKFIRFQNTENPFEFGFDYNTNKVKYIYIYIINETDVPINLFDDITNHSTLENIENSNTKFNYNKQSGENLFDDNNVEQTVSFNIDNGVIVCFTWTKSDFNKQPADRVMVMQGSEENTTVSNQTTSETTVATTVAETTIEPSTVDTKTATIDSTFTDNEFSPVVIIIIIIGAILIFGFGAGVIFFLHKRKF